jgi:hypothetical protein
MHGFELVAFIQSINGHIIEVSCWTLGRIPRMYVCTLLYGFGTVYVKRLHYTYSWAYTYTILYPYNYNILYYQYYDTPRS